MGRARREDHRAVHGRITAVVPKKQNTTHCAVLVEGAPFIRISHPSCTAFLEFGHFSDDQALTTGSLFRSTLYLRPRPCFWDSALPATDFTRGDERLLRRSLLAFVATRRLVVFL